MKGLLRTALAVIFCLLCLSTVAVAIEGVVDYFEDVDVADTVELSPEPELPPEDWSVEEDLFPEEEPRELDGAVDTPTPSRVITSTRAPSDATSDSDVVEDDIIEEDVDTIVLPDLTNWLLPEELVGPDPAEVMNLPVSDFGDSTVAIAEVTGTDIIADAVAMREHNKEVLDSVDSGWLPGELPTAQRSIRDWLSMLALLITLVVVVVGWVIHTIRERNDPLRKWWS